jgi:hypothetical protein
LPSFTVLDGSLAEKPSTVSSYQRVRSFDCCLCATLSRPGGFSICSERAEAFEPSAPTSILCDGGFHSVRGHRNVGG